MTSNAPEWWSNTYLQHVSNILPNKQLTCCELMSIWDWQHQLRTYLHHRCEDSVSVSRRVLERAFRTCLYTCCHVFTTDVWTRVWTGASSHPLESPLVWTCSQHYWTMLPNNWPNTIANIHLTMLKWVFTTDVWRCMRTLPNNKVFLLFIVFLHFCCCSSTLKTEHISVVKSGCDWLPERSTHCLAL